MSESSGHRGLAVVTGAASGIGLAAVCALSEVGTTVVGVDLAPRPDAAGAAEWVQGDVAAEETWDTVAELTRQLDPAGADCLISSAADVSVAPFLGTPIAEWRRLLDVNVLGPVLGMQTLIPPMLARGEGAVAVVCSINSLFAEVELSGYSTTKAALLQVVRSAAIEYARFGIRVNAVLPGCVDTPLIRRHMDALDDPAAGWALLERRIPTGKVSTPDEIAAVLRFLVSREASAFAGAMVTADAGLTATYDFDSTPA